jgi:hypothetical protein
MEQLEKNNMKEKYSNFDGMTSEVPNDMPWSNTRWSNFNQKDETITLDHYDSNLGPNSQLTLPDSDGSAPNMTTETWSNHPGFIGGTWFKDFFRPGAAEKERAQDATSKIRARYPNSGSCDLLLDTEDRINSAIAAKANDAENGGRGARRVAKRELPILEQRLSSVSAAAESQCASENKASQAQQEQMMMMQQMTQQQVGGSKGINPLYIGLGVLAIGGLFFFMSRNKAPKV